MNPLIFSLFLATAATVCGMAPPSSRPDAPSVSLVQVIELAATRAKEIDPSAYAGEAVFRYADMSPRPDEFTRDRWEVVFYRPEGSKTAVGFPDIVIAVSLDGVKTKVLKK